MKEVYSCPYDELPLKSEKYAAICTDIHLGNRGITLLQGFEKFVCLDTVWLNNNKIQSIDGLGENVRLKCIHLYCNRIKRLEKNSLAPFKLLSRLTLNDNLLDDLDSTLNELKLLRNLLSLDLFNNPIAKEDNYRLRVLAAIPSLTMFDRHRINDMERIEVNNFKKKMKKLNQFNLTSANRSEKVSSKNSERTTVDSAVMKNLLSLLGRHATDKRCFLELSFLEIDRRHLGIIEEDAFWNILRHYGLAQLLSDSERGLLMRRYKRSIEVEALSATGTLRRACVQYRKFCRDILPVGMRVIKDDEAWKTDRVPGVSVSTEALGQYVQTVKKQKLFEETETRKRLILTSTQSLSDIPAISRSKVPDCGLGPWELSELSRVISTAEAVESVTMVRGDVSRKSSMNPVQGDVYFTRQQCEDIFKFVSSFKKVPVLGVSSALDMLFDQLTEGPGINTRLFRASIGCPQTPVRTPAPVSPVRTAPISAAKNRKQETLDVRPFTVGAVVDEQKEKQGTLTEIDRLFKNPIVQWRDMIEEERQALEGEVTAQSTQILDSLLRSPGGDDVRALSAEALRLCVVASRLGGSKVKTPTKRYDSPSEMIASAGNRSDIIVLPNLKLSISMKEVGGTLGMSSAFSPQPQPRPTAMSLTPLTFKQSVDLKSNTRNLDSSYRNTLSMTQTKGGQGQGQGGTPPLSLSKSKGWAPGTATIVLV